MGNLVPGRQRHDQAGAQVTVEDLIRCPRKLTRPELDALNLAAKEYRALRETEPFREYALNHASETLGYQLLATGPA